MVICLVLYLYINTSRNYRKFAYPLYILYIYFIKPLYKLYF